MEHLLFKNRYWGIGPHLLVGGNYFVNLQCNSQTSYFRNRIVAPNEERFKRNKERTEPVCCPADPEKLKASETGEAGMLPKMIDETTMTELVTTDQQWKLVVSRLDLVFFYLFLTIFAVLLGIMIFPYHHSVSVDRDNCTLYV